MEVKLDWVHAVLYTAETDNYLIELRSYLEDGKVRWSYQFYEPMEGTPEDGLAGDGYITLKEAKAAIKAKLGE